MRKFPAVVLGAIISSSAAADGVYVGGHAGVLLGTGIEVGFESERFGLRGQMAEFSYDESDTFDDVRYDLDANLGSQALLVDFYPMSNGLFLTAGLYQNSNTVDALGQPAADTVQIGNVVYASDDVGALLADVDIGGTTPYVGLGYTLGKEDGGFAVSLEAGAQFSGEADVSLVSVGGNPVITNDPDFQTQLRQEEQNLQDDLDALEIIPVIKLGVRFYL